VEAGGAAFAEDLDLEGQAIDDAVRGQEALGDRLARPVREAAGGAPSYDLSVEPDRLPRHHVGVMGVHNDAGEPAGRARGLLGHGGALADEVGGLVVADEAVEAGSAGV
jgi:hypothetical protein